MFENGRLLKLAAEQDSVWLISVAISRGYNLKKMIIRSRRFGAFDLANKFQEIYDKQINFDQFIPVNIIEKQVGSHFRGV